MTIAELRALIRWADTAEGDAGFWKRIYFAAFALDLRTRLLIQALVARYGVLPEGVAP